MASYPTGVFSPSAKSNGQTIQAAHVGDLDAEVTAIENALLNGIPHNVAVNAALAVTGPVTLSTNVQAGVSTLAALQVDGNSTFAGNVTITGTLTAGSFAQARPSVCRLGHSTVQAIPTATWQGVVFDTEREDNASMHSTAANSSRMLLTSSGVWAIGVNIEFAQNSSGYRHLRVVVNDSTAVTLAEVTGLGNNGNESALQATTLYVATSTSDYVTVQVFQTVGANLNVLSHSQHSPHFWAYKVSQ